MQSKRGKTPTGIQVLAERFDKLMSESIEPYSTNIEQEILSQVRSVDWGQVVVKKKDGKVTLIEVIETIRMD